MKREEIIEAGLLERHVLGELSQEELMMLESQLEADGELRAQLSQLEEDLESMALENAIVPPAAIKAAVMEASDPKQKVIQLKRNERNAYFAIAASLAAVFMLTSGWLFKEVRQMENQVEVVQTENSELQTELEKINDQYDRTQQWYTAINDPNTERYLMKGNLKSPQTEVISYVNHTEKEVYLNTVGLPELSDEEDYQLWGDVDGEMIDMGVIPKGESMVAMRYLDEAESLNITIEPAGGSDHPTVTRLITNVYLN
ncbi:anti-sigma factor [Aureitalea marina]|uniref:Anti-sigma K factor RskA C-terminal domain-containing protein n=1 Tax=Aureitalea marina TaxID=930804 RepID=A0A2S7KQA6_9FLAO|nr:anti-sigma factor [Aureitalea marina]PQB04753.1 hypothetical protein BST85_07485 [Aureitalea marina]